MLSKLTPILFYLLYSAHLFCNDNASDLIDSKDRVVISDFFKELLMRESGIYTIFGSKPITEVPIFYLTENPKKEGVFQKAYKKAAEEYKKKGLGIYKYAADYREDRLFKGWQIWKKYQNKFPSKKYLLFERKNKNTGSEYSVFLVNIFETAYCIYKHYPLFRKAVGFDFHPLEVVFELQNSDSLFWYKVRDFKKNHHLIGILYGYGEKQSLFFQWKADAELFSKPVREFLKLLKGPPSDKKNLHNVRTEQLSFDNLTIPLFGFFSNSTPVSLLDKYNQQKERIKKIYSKGDFLEITLEKFIE